MNLETMQLETENLIAEELLKWAFEKFGEELIFASSFGAEDMVIIDMIYNLGIPINIITLDTGRLPKETYKLIERTRERYKLPIKTYFPDYQNVEKMVGTKGHFSFKESIENRKECCKIRKIDSLKRALNGKKAWITGLRKSQSLTRTEIKNLDLDLFFGNIFKFNPLVEWTEEDVWKYIKKNNVPYNELHKMGYPSIGCEPCTRSITLGDDIRAGRWWWENPEQKECGLHK